MISLASLRGRISRNLVAAVFGALLATGLGLFLHTYNLGRGLINHSYELQLVARGDVRAREAVIVYMDETSHAALKQPLNAPWDRSLHASLIRRLTAAGARAIVFDIIFSDADARNPAADAGLAKAIQDSGRVILGIDVVRLGLTDRRGIPPIELFEKHAAGIGSVEALADSDLVVRRLNSWDYHLDIPSLSWATASFLGVKIEKNENSWQASRWMNYYGPPHYLPSVGYSEALNPAVVEDSFFRDKVVFVGARLLTKFAGERKDEYAHPFSYWLTSDMETQSGTMNFIAGVEIQATAFLNLLRGDWLSRLPLATERTVIVGLGLLFGFGLVRLRPVMATVVGLGGLALVVAGLQVLFTHKLIWFPWLIVLVQIGVALSWSILFNSVQFYVQQRLFEHTLSLYLSPKLVKKFAGNPKLLKPGAEEQIISIFFSDIANFTEISRHLDSDALAGLMNRYFETAVSKCIHPTDGTVVKYIGDAVFAFWNAPEGQIDHAWRACGAALRFRDQVSQVVDGKPLRTRIGIHSGLARVGNFGSAERVDYTALGESVNLASRLEGLNKFLGTECIISRETREGIGDRLVTRPLGLFQLKGFGKPVEVHELVGWPEEEEKTRPWREAFAQALADYQARKLDAAEQGFRRTLELRPGDGPSESYLARLEELRAQPLPDDWETHTVMREK
jgi:adenylate cyclase